MVYCPFHEGKLETCSCEVANGSPNVIMITSLFRSCVSREVQALIVLCEATFVPLFPVLQGDYA